MCGFCHHPVCDGVDHFRASSGNNSEKSASNSGTPIDQIINQLNRGGYSWTTTDPITYSFAASLPFYAFGEDQYAGFQAFSEQQEVMARLALSTWSDVADITFEENIYGTGAIRFANSSSLADYSAAHAYLPGTKGWSGDVWVNSTLGFNVSPEVGNYGFKVLVHELGHSIGQLHPGDYNAGSGRLSYARNAEYAEDSQQYSIMSYWDEDNTGAEYGVSYAQTPMLHDIAAIQAKYGANMDTRTGDTVYGFNSNTDSPLFDFEQNKNPVLSIWDADGIDTLDFSGFSEDSVLDLNPGGFSSTAGLVNNISIAFGADIENAVTGRGNDVILGNALNNVVDAGAGRDTFVLQADQNAATVYVFDTRPIVIHSAQGTDQLTSVETISFADIDVDVASQTSISLLEYAASHADVAEAFGTDEDLLYTHLVEHGLNEGRTIDFSALDYIASHRDLIEVYGADIEAGVLHYLEFGLAEGRGVTFDAAAFLDANPDLVDVQGMSLSAAQLYIEM
ncbi:M10 family metallopeptidase C-terminal domain-containing protein [Roseibium sp.]|uniref:M10 family metallopeptidase C-terminal domain-containing protein n=1 Tax=Roseibium sp. TaxID=1936156 RepID=UPI003B5260EA